MTTVSEYAGQLVVLRCWCGVQHAVPQSLRDEQMRYHNTGRSMSIYCPLGHTYVPSGEPEVLKVQRALAAEISKHDQTKAALKAERNKLNSEKAAKSRLKNRVKNGVCPCCKRSFANLHRHMQGQHPDFGNATEA